MPEFDAATLFLRPMVTLVNTLLLLWLGSTVLLQPERRRASVYFASLSLLAAAAFHGAYTIQLGGGRVVVFVLVYLWYPTLATLYVLPLCWFAVVLYFAGYFDEHKARLKRSVSVYLVVLLFFATPGGPWQAGSIPDLAAIVGGNVPFQRAPFAYTLFLILFALYLLTSTGAALMILLTRRRRGGNLKDTARARARSSILGAGAALFCVSLVVGAFLVWFLYNRYHDHTNFVDEVRLLMDLDTPVALLVTVAILFTGRATIYYELFSGALPRRGLFRQWHLVIFFALAAGLFFACVRWWMGTGGFTIMSTACLAVLVFVLMGRSQNRERNRHLEVLRPFLSSQNLYGSVIQAGRRSKTGQVGDALPHPFPELCRDILHCERAYLFPLGEARLFIDTPLVYPPAPGERKLPSAESLHELELRFARIAGEAGGSGELLNSRPFANPRLLSVDPGRYGGAILAVPLWSADSARSSEEFRNGPGVAGVLLLGEQRGGGLYTQEEVEIAQAAAERLVDTLAAARLSRIVVSLQRSRILEGKLGDDRARRVVHDDILPAIHAAILELSHISGGENVLAGLTDIHARLSQLLREIPAAVHPDLERLGLSHALRHAAEREGGFDRLVWKSNTEADRAAQRLPALALETVFYAAREMIRNAARHGRRDDRESELRFTMSVLDAAARSSALELIIEDNGPGLNGKERKDAPAAETTDNVRNGGAGQGLSLHGALLAVAGGSLSFDSAPGRYTRARITISVG